MKYIDYGLNLFRAQAFDDWPEGASFDLADVLQSLLTKRQLANYEVYNRFYEIGSLQGLTELSEYLCRANICPQL